MKTCEEMIVCVFERMDEYEKVKAKRKKAAVRTAALLLPVSVAAAAGLGAWNSQLTVPPSADIPEVFTAETTVAAAVRTTAVTATTATVHTEQITEAAIVTEAPTEVPSSDPVTEEETASEETGPVTEEPDVQAAAAQTITETEPVTAVPYEPNTVSPEGEVSLPSMDVLCWVKIDGDYYVQRSQYNTDSSMYTSDDMIGLSNDFEGLFRDTEPCGEFCTAKEDSNIIILEFYSGGRIVLVNTGSEPVWFEN